MLYFAVHLLLAVPALSHLRSGFPCLLVTLGPSSLPLFLPLWCPPSQSFPFCTASLHCGPFRLSGRCSFRIPYCLPAWPVASFFVYDRSPPLALPLGFTHLRTCRFSVPVLPVFFVRLLWPRPCSPCCPHGRKGIPFLPPSALPSAFLLSAPGFF